MLKPLWLGGGVLLLLLPQPAIKRMLLIAARATNVAGDAITRSKVTIGFRDYRSSGIVGEISNLE